MEGEVRFFQAQDQPSATTHVRVGNRVFSHTLDVVSKKLHEKTLKHCVARQDPRYGGPEEGKDVKLTCIHTILKLAHLRWTSHVTRIPD